jgi:hypothetical protein
MSLNERVKHTDKNVKEQRKKNKKQIDAFKARSRKAFKDCGNKRDKQMTKQIKGK